MAKPTIQQVAELGFIFPEARGWMGERAAMDAALMTTPNTTVPVEFVAWIDPMVIEILTAPRRARELFPEEKKGTWVTPYEKWRTDEIVGQSEPYSDYANGTTSGVNSNWNVREQYIFQTSITYGDLEVDLSSAAKMNLASSKQKAAAQILDIDANRFYLLGVEGREIYGLLNDPNLPASITPPATGTGGGVKWETKTTVQIYEDILLLFRQLATQSAGLIDNASPLTLAVSPEANVLLGKPTDFGITVLGMLENYFTDLKIVVLPELHSTTAGDTALLVAREINGIPTGSLAFGEKMRAGRVIPDMSSFRQKFVASTYGGIVLQPFAFASMTGV